MVQEYILSRGHLLGGGNGNGSGSGGSGSGGGGGSDHLGVSLAREVATHRSPVYHLAGGCG